MRNSTSILSLILALGIYGAGPIVTKSGPFGATVAYAGEGGEGGDGGEGDEGGNGDSDDGDDGDSDVDDNSDDGDDDNALCVVDCNEN